LSDDEAAVFLSHKKERTSVYSGKKSLSAVLSLKEYCIHVLKKNIDSIKYLRKVPYNVIQPVLECCTPSQLVNLENHNKYLMDHTNELWKKFCQKCYKDEVPQKHETWRSVYLRANKGKEKKLKGIIASIAASKAKSQPERQLKLADAPVKYSQGSSKITKNTVNAGSPLFASSKVDSPLSASKISPSTSTAKVTSESHIKYSHSNNKLTKGVVNSSSSPSVSSSKVSPPVAAPSVNVSKTSPPLSSAKVSKPQKKHKKAAEAPLMSKVKKSMGLYKQK
ncbi:elongin-A-like, partial [Stegodyphus dumicola]|uniref:elongin-A-like n=1 Tax=Stegodyphus dumicola TaxID=202533 RepID=UPI0015A7BF7E